MKAAWGCEERSQMSTPAFVDDGFDLIQPDKYKRNKHNGYWNCPIKFIPDNVFKLLNMYDSIKMFPNMPLPAYKNMSKRFLWAIQYYESKYNEYVILAMGDK